jgi:hypothetical protein
MDLDRARKREEVISSFITSLRMSIKLVFSESAQKQMIIIYFQIILNDRQRLEAELARLKNEIRELKMKASSA